MKFDFEVLIRCLLDTVLLHIPPYKESQTVTHFLQEPGMVSLYHSEEP